MAEVPGVASLMRGGAVRAVPSVVRQRPRSAARSRATREPMLSRPFALSEARRIMNRDRIGRCADLRCECARPSCRDQVPAVAEAHRRMANQFVVAPAHFDGGVVVRAADRFFVVESGRCAIRRSRGDARRI